MMSELKDSQWLHALKERRKRIDQIDQKLLSLLNQRLSIALEIGAMKRERGEKIYDPQREEQILQKLHLRNRGPLRSEDLTKIFKKIMIVCRKSQIRSDSC